MATISSCNWSHQWKLNRLVMTSGFSSKCVLSTSTISTNYLYLGWFGAIRSCSKACIFPQWCSARLVPFCPIESCKQQRKTWHAQRMPKFFLSQGRTHQSVLSSPFDPRRHMLCSIPVQENESTSISKQSNKVTHNRVHMHEIPHPLHTCVHRPNLTLQGQSTNSFQ